VRARDGEEGGASLEMVGSLPFLLLAVLVAAQIAAAGASLWSAGVAARAGSRASAVGRPGRAAALGALPPALREGARVYGSGGGLEVKVPVPRLLPGMPAFEVGAKTRISPGG
jgi:hypothetical protein